MMEDKMLIEINEQSGQKKEEVVKLRPQII